jgi:hypothetical protein
MRRERVSLSAKASEEAGWLSVQQPRRSKVVVKLCVRAHYECKELLIWTAAGIGFKEARHMGCKSKLLWVSDA